MACRIYSYPNNPRVFKALIAAQYNGVTVEQPADFQLGITNKTAEFLAKFPFGKVPVMDTPDGPLFESNAIANYIAYAKEGSPLVGQNPYEIALIQQFINLADNEISPAAATWLYPILGYVQFNEANTKKAQEDVRKALTILNNVLLDRTYLVGERVTLADISVVCSVYHLYKMVLDPETRKPYANLNRWFTTMVEQPQFKAILGETKLCVVPEVYDPSKLIPKTAPAASTTTTAAAAHDDEEDEEASKPKAKNPLDLLPPSTFVLDEWKRFYSNNETRPDACDFFWKKFDPEGYSMWRLVYKFNDELTKVFMSSNLIGGFYQRLEDSRKYAFGNMVVFGEENNSAIAGMFIYRGQEIPPMIKETADFDSYDFTKVDPSDPAIRAEWETYLAWDGEFAGKKFADAKTFK